MVESGDRTLGVISQGRQVDAGSLTEGVCLGDADRQQVAPMCPAQVVAAQGQQCTALQEAKESDQHSGPKH